MSTTSANNELCPYIPLYSLIILVRSAYETVGFS